MLALFDDGSPHSIGGCGRSASTVSGPADQTRAGGASMESQRLTHLDALRGIAAAVVVAHHALLAMSNVGTQSAGWSPFNIVLLGRPAVVLFFVLSGFVLTLHLHAAQAGYVGFAARRLIRLLVPYAAAIGMAAAAFGLTRHDAATGLSDWFDAQWKQGISGADVLRHLALLAGPRQFPLDHVSWSLVDELRLSLALPLFLVGQHRYGPVVAIAAAAGMTLLAERLVNIWPSAFPAGVYGLRFDAEGLGLSLILTARFCFAFALGSVLASHGEPVRQVMRRPWGGMLGLAAGLTLLSARSELAMAFGAAALVAVAAWAPAVITALSMPTLMRLGRISFSLYLVHLPTMLTCVYAGQGHGPAWVRLLVGIGLAFPIATVMTRWVEEPAIRWSRAAARVSQARPTNRSNSAIGCTASLSKIGHCGPSALTDVNQAAGG